MSAARPETGATPQQVEEAKARRFAKSPLASKTSWMFLAERFRERLYPEIEDVASDLVPPTHVIALAEHVVSAADREAIGRAADHAHARKTDFIKRYVNTRIDQNNGDATMDEIDEWQGEAERQWNETYPTHADDLARLERLGSGGEETT